MTTDKKENDNTNNSKKINKKGIILTGILVIGIIGASFIVWFLPSENVQNGGGMSNMTITFSDPNDTLTSVNSQFLLIQNEVQNQIDNTKANTFNRTYIDNVIGVSIVQNNELMQNLLNGQPDQSIMPKYVESMNNLKDYSMYLLNVKNITSNSDNVSHDLKNLGNFSIILK
jgi:hypothetical protein